MEGNSKRHKKKLQVRSHGMEEKIDRLSDLPDNIIERILSFLDTKSVVQTSLLSRRWRCVWKAVPTLNFYRKCFRKKSSFIEHVNKFLSLRFDSVTVGSITLEFGRDVWQRGGIELFHSVMRHAAAVRGSQLYHLSIKHNYGEFSDIAASIAAYDHHESLKILKLYRLVLCNRALSSLGFKLLTTLELDFCRLFEPNPPQVGPFDSLADLPTCLKYLKLIDCRSSYRVKVSAPELLDLEITSSCFYRGIEVSATKLKSFRLSDNMLEFKMSPYKFNFPSLDQASIRVWCKYEYYWKKYDLTILEDACRAYKNLLRGLYNVESLNLRFDMSESGLAWEEHLYPFSRMKQLVESPEASPFTRLKTLRVQYQQDPPSLPYEVIRYFFESSSSTGDKSVRFEKIK